MNKKPTAVPKMVMKIVINSDLSVSVDNFPDNLGVCVQVMVNATVAITQYFNRKAAEKRSNLIVVPKPGEGITLK